jgi:2-haloacid dehalogenase
LGLSRITSVVFDVGNVLVHWDIRKLYASSFDSQAAVDRFCAEVVTPEWHFQHDAGAPLSETIPALVQRYPEHRKLIEAYEPRWMETVGPVVDGMDDLLAELEAANIPLFAITNFSIELWPRFVAATPFISKFRDVIVSGAHKIVKPDPAIYKLALQRFKMAENQAIFIDDRIENITAATENGFAGHHFQTAEKLRADLVSLGLLA